MTFELSISSNSERILWIMLTFAVLPCKKSAFSYEQNSFCPVQICASYNEIIIDIAYFLKISATF